MNRLKPGEILSLADGSEAIVESLEIEEAKEGEEFTTYNFEVEDWHTYFVLPKGSKESESNEAVWVHNLCDADLNLYTQEFHLRLEYTKRGRDTHVTSMLQFKEGNTTHLALARSSDGGFSNADVDSIMSFVDNFADDFKNTEFHFVDYNTRLTKPKLKMKHKKKGRIIDGVTTDRDADAEAKAIAYVLEQYGGSALNGAAQAASHYACGSCVTLQKHFGIRNVTGVMAGRKSFTIPGVSKGPYVDGEPADINYRKLKPPYWNPPTDRFLWNYSYQHLYDGPKVY